MGFYESTASLAPKPMREAFAKQLLYADVRLEVRRFVGFLLVYSLVASLVVASVLALFLHIPPAFTFLGFFAGFLVVPYLMLSLSADGKGQFVERILPDALQLISSNIRAGLTTEKALIVSARPEFGPLERELKRSSTEIMSGVPVEIALNGMPGRIKSRILEQTVWLLSRGIGSGGEISDLLIQLSNNLREQNALREEEQADVSTYVILIFFSSAFGAPALYGVSSFIVQVMTAQKPNVGSINLPAGTGGVSGFTTSMLQASKSTITVDFVVLFIEIMIVFGALFSAMTLGVINKGKEKEGLKYLPFLLLASFGVFLIVRTALLTVFGPILLK
ncbi:MAG TPA: hypothetical protein HA252_04875 [Candidatus Diapherotrites archaeon]|uniref:Type II secretion system F family protein n=1 Tax=Candidatus Iainarchaeum sp. TaxID=3101447 RepID=A0A7J4JG31_9ARCH|nr:type II secretion system F family protein [Candidatus Diapherotrites archaeon]HIH16712.1 hypothetical protein [Candidatus Diapherotrites archaeon]